MRFLIFILLLTSCAYKQEKVNTVVHNARIYACNNEFDIHQAMAINDGKIVEIGPERQIMNKYRAEKFIDCQARYIYPIFIDQENQIQAFINLLEELEDTDADQIGRASCREKE